MKKISIITPCFNEEEALYNCTSSIKKLFENQLKNFDYEHIICDNNSNEKTKTDKKVKVIL